MCRDHALTEFKLESELSITCILCLIIVRCLLHDGGSDMIRHGHRTARGRHAASHIATSCDACHDLFLTVIRRPMTQNVTRHPEVGAGRHEKPRSGGVHVIYSFNITRIRYTTRARYNAQHARYSAHARPRTWQAAISRLRYNACYSG